MTTRRGLVARTVIGALALVTSSTLALACRRPRAEVPRPDERAPSAAPDAGVAPVVEIAVDAAPPPPPPPHWLRGSTHVHASPSGDSVVHPDAVMAWYRAHGYDFIVLTDHNRITIVDPAFAPAGGRTSAAPAEGPIVVTGLELTYNPGACTEPSPPPPPDGKCRIHVNGVGVTGRAEGRIEWADRTHRDRLSSYRAALRYVASVGGLAQINHPQWSWGMTPELLTALAGDGALLVEIANVAFDRWNHGDADHPSPEALWDDALRAGARLWAVASDDAHSYGAVGGKYPAGGGWVEVDAAPDAEAIVAALAAGRFYASTGVALAWAGPVGDELVVEAAADEPGPLTTHFVVDGAVVATSTARRATYPLPTAPSYVRARVTRADGAQAWLQPAARPRP